MLAFDPARDRAPAAEQPRVLVVEDDFFLGIMVEEALRNAGFVVVGIATDMQQAMTFASDQGPDLALMDIHLAHGDDGVDTAVALMREFGIRSLFVSAHADEQTRSRADAARPLGWLVKPFKLIGLTTAVTEALSALAKEKGAEGDAS
jgi:DNA-binding response OmpR family regulator